MRHPLLRPALFFCFAALVLMLLAGCALPNREPSYQGAAHPTQNKTAIEAEATGTTTGSFLPKPEIAGPLILRTEGYASQITRSGLSQQQERLLAMQASRMDALRAMSERVNGIYLRGFSEATNMSLSEDQLRAHTDSLVQGSRVVYTREVNEGIFETQVELVIHPEKGILLGW